MILRIACALLLCTLSASAQSSLSLVDKLPPYNLTAVLLSNGHFSISTSYTGTSKPLIYREDGTGNRPINYTSHIHVKVDGVVYKLGYEVDETTGAPPPNQIAVNRLFRDTVNNRPRINADMRILHGVGDTIGVIFTMEPVKRPSGAFIRLSVLIQNKGVRSHDVGVLMLIDTKIGDNDRAPIATSFGYSNLETQYQLGVGNGIPDYWIALEGTPIAPGLTARGNLVESDLVTPDLFILGNWVDDPNRATIGLRLNEWDERLATGFDYSDSSVLLIWDPKAVARGASVLRAATEIGLVDSLEIGVGGGAGGSDVILAGSGIGSGANGCIGVELNDQVPCSIVPYHPYLPDTLEPLFLVTNNSTQTMNNVTVDVNAVVPGVDVVRTSTQVIPSTLDTMQTGVGNIALALRPRLQAQTYRVPFEIRATAMTPPMFDTICINVPGVQAVVNAFDLTTANLCPQQPDTVMLMIDIDGPRCLPLVEFTVLGTTTATINLIPALPFQLSAQTQTAVPIEVTVPNVGSTSVRIRVRVREFETLAPGDTTFVDHIDTITLTIPARLAEYEVVGLVDTLDMGQVCIRDSLYMDFLVQNIGGCDVTLTSMSFTNTAGGRFSTAPIPVLPTTFSRGETVRPRIRFSSLTSGTFVGTLTFQSAARPGTLNVPVKATVVNPSYDVVDTVDLDTVCANTDIVTSIAIRTPVNCPVQIDSVDLVGTSITSAVTGSFIVPSRGQVSVPLIVRRSVDGPFSETITVLSAEAGNQTVVVRGVMGTSALNTQPIVDGGDIRVGTSRTMTSTINAVGSFSITITQLRAIGPNGNEFVVRPTSGATLPLTIPAGGSLDVDVICTPTDIEQRTAQLFITTLRPLCTPSQPIDLVMRGIRPLLSADRPQYDLGRSCIGGPTDTTVVLRNRGNAPLNVLGVRVSNADITVQSTFPIALPPADTAVIAVRVNPSRLGVARYDLRIDHDGDFAVEADSVITVDVQGIICGTIAADSTVGVVGEVIATSLLWMPDTTAPLTLDEVVTLLAQRNEGIVLSVAHDQRVIRGRVLSGGVTNVPSTSLRVTPDSIHINAPTPQANGTNVIARIDVDLLRGGLERTDVAPAVMNLASGDADVDVQNGQVRTLICAYDGRGLVVNGFVVMRDLASRDLIAVGLTAPAVLTAYTLDGRVILEFPVAPTPGGVVLIPSSSLPQTYSPTLIAIRMGDKVAHTLLR